jgi:ABC-type transport system involved in multi-copper enzyme maturation permease subunit
MTFLPIVERELRVAARRSATFGMRVKIAGAAALGVAACFLASLIAPSVSFGQTLFWGLSGLCMIYCIFAGRIMTADCLSREKREGTLGLLFLTDLKGHDVVLGKLVATSLAGFYVLIALIPFLAVPFLAGGMTSGELWRMALVLVNTFLFSLAVGLFASSISRDHRKAMGANLLLLLALAAGPVAIEGLLVLINPRLLPIQELLYTCPAYPFLLSADKRFALSPSHFWWSLATVFDLTIVLVLLASQTTPRAWQDKFAPRKVPQKSEPRPRAMRKGAGEKSAAFRARLLNVSAYFWLAARPGRKVIYVWILMALVACWWMIPHLFFASVEMEAGYALAIMLNLALKLWITVEAGSQMAEDKKSGAFELLLTTPVTLRDIVRGQFMALRRQFLAPLVVAVVFELILMFLVPYKRTELVPGRLFWAALIVILAADVITLIWAAMSAALTEKSHDRATIKTALLVLVLPTLLFGGVYMAERMWHFSMNGSDDGDWTQNVAWWFGLGAYVDAVVFIKAWRRMRAMFTKYLSEPAVPPQRIDWFRGWRKKRSETETTLPSKVRRIAIAVVTILLIGWASVFYASYAMHVEPPKPSLVSISQIKNPLRISGSRGFLFLFPNGTLWRWGLYDGVSPPRQVGTASNWIQASVRGNSAAGLLSDGTLWAWNPEKEEPKQVGSNHDWVQARAVNDSYVALKRDGTLWDFAEVSTNNTGPIHRKLLQIGTNNDWKSIGIIPVGGSRIALRQDGTLWAWGNAHYLSYGMWGGTNFPAPVRLCRESNWAGFSDEIAGGVRNQAGESWAISPLARRPGPDVSIRALGTQVSSNATTSALGLFFTNNWTLASFETRPDGALWATPMSWRGGYQPTALPFRVGQRSDWVSVWGTFETTIGLTSDGTLWAWGRDYGQDAHYELAERFGIIRETIATVLGAEPQSSIRAMQDECRPYYPQKEPRRLIQILVTNSPTTNLAR